ncbi:hypothetical protein PoMZ_03307 [Pyricularia oryzae]|uniref:Uncharacterized protein n=1 Tax=Pyricularia oryzae TaxID=318829 RepID=A0A4V1C620_PYROR|nr:hypothetical protein PoMZ_03307 [Pyricularia oryzae]
MSEATSGSDLASFGTNWRGGGKRITAGRSAYRGGDVEFFWRRFTYTTYACALLAEQCIYPASAFLCIGLGLYLRHFGANMILFFILF